MKTRLLFPALVLLAATLRAQTPAETPPPLPPGPLIQKRAPKMSQWLITLVVSSQPATAQASPGAKPNTAKPYASKVAITKTDEIIREETLDEKGRTWTAWCLPGLQITLWPDGKSWFVQQSQVMQDPDAPVPMYTDYSKTDFQGFDWIAASNYAGIQQVSGKRCIMFKTGGPSPAADPAAQKSTPAGAPADTAAPAPPPPVKIAYIDLETRLPVAIVSGAEGHTYQFMPAPEQRLTFPPIVQSLLDNRTKAMQSAKRRNVNSF